MDVLAIFLFVKSIVKIGRDTHVSTHARSLSLARSLALSLSQVRNTGIGTGFFRDGHCSTGPQVCWQSVRPHTSSLRLKASYTSRLRLKATYTSSLMPDT